MEITTVGLDIAKRVFQLHGVDAAGKAVLRRKLQRSEALAFFKALPSSVKRPSIYKHAACGRELKYLTLMVGYTQSSTWEAHRWVRPRSPCAAQNSSKQ